ncbi:MAG: metallopeptidase family protein [Candidatus Pacebacteria bacterium]|nr:metallopeptidase family protein [Candidatus Paceibacterota bacterium]MDR3583012.1 metallopeptidase family protein [Candidatus Paceibacterota bacterium]
MKIARRQFDQWVAEAIEMVPKKLTQNLGRLVFVVDDRPTLAIIRESRLRRGYALFGYYQGYEQTGRKKRAVEPDKVYIFRRSICEQYKTLRATKGQVMKTVWHEISHHFGSDEDGALRAEKRMFESYSQQSLAYRTKKREMKKLTRVKKIRQGYKRKTKVTFRVEKV